MRVLPVVGAARGGGVMARAGARAKARAVCRAGLVALVVAGATAGCTGAVARTSPPTSAQPPATVADTRAGTPGPQMTPVDAAKCSTTTVRGPGSGPLQVDGRWRPDPDALPDETVTVTRGPDADTCPGELPPQPFCSQAIPWTGLSVDALVHASGMERWVSSSVPGPDGRRPGAPPDPRRVPRTLTYTVMTPPPGGRLAIGPALVAGAAACADTTESRAGSGTRLRGTVVDRWAPATDGAPRAAGFLAVVGPDGVGWALLGGPPWSGRDVDSAQAALETALARSRGRSQP
ncbi:hypothetical protein [Terrabacter sp. NPDC080008]|uniref:hypothetical protein n=1 Tax=Terrabacter sp. NPDC080008 TaxID=3155176 RepID=UPI0034506FBC